MPDRFDRGGGRSDGRGSLIRLLVRWFGGFRSAFLLWKHGEWSWACRSGCNALFPSPIAFGIGMVIFRVHCFLTLNLLNPRPRIWQYGVYKQVEYTAGHNFLIMLQNKILNKRQNNMGRHVPSHMNPMHTLRRQLPKRIRRLKLPPQQRTRPMHLDPNALPRLILHAHRPDPNLQPHQPGVTNSSRSCGWNG